MKISIDGIIAVCMSWGPAIWDFMQEFGIRIGLAVVFCLFLVRIIRVVAWVWHSALIQKIKLSVWHAMNRFAQTHAVCKLLVDSIVRSGELMEIFYRGFHSIDYNDDLEDAGEKIRANFLRGLAYDIADYPMAIGCLTFVGILVDHQWSYDKIFLAMWLVDLIIIIVMYIGCERSGQDLSLGRAYRNAWEEVDMASGWAGRILVTWRYFFATIWDGPVQIIYFHEQELNALWKKTIAALFLTCAQGAFWAYVYSVGHDSIIARAMNFFGA